MRNNWSYTLLYLFLISSDEVFPQLADTYPLNRYNSVGGYSKNFNDPYSFSGNEASLATLEAGNVAVYHETKYILKELNFSSVVLSFATSAGGVAIVIDHSGNKHFNISSFGIAYGKKLNDFISLGAQFKYHLYKIEGYGSEPSVQTVLALKLKLSDAVQTGFQIIHASSPGIPLQLPLRYCTGIGYDLSEQLYLYADIVKLSGQPVDITIATLYALNRQCLVTAGILTSPGSPFISVAYRVKSNTSKFSLNYNPQLGFTPSLMVSFHLKKNND
jgi:hypothetical protein